MYRGITANTITLHHWAYSACMWRFLRGQDNQRRSVLSHNIHRHVCWYVTQLDSRVWASLIGCRHHPRDQLPSSSRLHYRHFLPGSVLSSTLLFPSVRDASGVMIVAPAERRRPYPVASGLTAPAIFPRELTGIHACGLVYWCLATSCREY